MTIKERIIKEIALSRGLPLEEVHAIISFQGEDAFKAAHIANEIEFSGFGKFYLSQTRLKRKIDNMENKLSDIEEEKLPAYVKHLEDLKQRIR